MSMIVIGTELGITWMHLSTTYNISKSKSKSKSYSYSYSYSYVAYSPEIFFYRFTKVIPSLV